MIEKKRRCAAFAVCGSFCTLEAALDAASYRWSWLPPPCHGSPYIRMLLPPGRASSVARSSFMVSTS